MIFSRITDLESESREIVLARAEEEKKEPFVGELGGKLLDILDMPYNGEDGRLAPGVKFWKTKRLLAIAMHVSPISEHKLYKAGMAASRAAILVGRNLGYASQLQYDVDHRPFA